MTEQSRETLPLRAWKPRFQLGPFSSGALTPGDRCRAQTCLIPNVQSVWLEHILCFSMVQSNLPGVSAPWEEPRPPRSWKEPAPTFKMYLERSLCWLVACRLFLCDILLLKTRHLLGNRKTLTNLLHELFPATGRRLSEGILNKKTP